MMIKVLENTSLELSAVEAELELEKQIIVGGFNALERIPGHCIDYLDSTTRYVTLCAEKESNLLLWDSHSLFENGVDNSFFNVHFKVSLEVFSSNVPRLDCGIHEFYDSTGSRDQASGRWQGWSDLSDLALFLDEKELESWCARNRIILRKLKDDVHLTYYFTLLNSHKITGELIVSPVLYFEKHPSFTLDGDLNGLSQLFKTKPIVLEVKKNQVICFDKYHYQMAYNPNFYCIRVNNARRSD